ncbi:VanW family protein [Actinomadura sp. SCN-SB]|uniref:VanW family protein n=1 Tax=Actinomadura sp. SCN-SB TaxID=3373092 RepID=UPI003752A870
MPETSEIDQVQAAAGSGSRASRPTLPLMLVAAAGVILVLLAVVVRALTIAGEVPGGTRVAGVEIGGLSPADAEAKLARGLADEAERPITVMAAGHRFSITPNDAGLSLDAKATVAAAGGGAPSPTDLLRPLIGQRDIEPKIKLDARRLSAAVDGIAKEVDRPVREGGIRYTGLRPVPVIPKGGSGIDRAATQRAIKDAFLAPRTQVTVSLRPTSATVPAAEVRRIAATTAREAVRQPLLLTRQGRTVPVPPSEIARDLRYVADGRGSLRPEFDATELARNVEKKFVPAAQAPRNATFEVKKGRLELVSARTGLGVDAAKLGQAVERVLAASQSRTVPVDVVTTPPRITDAQARSMGIKERISTFTTRHPCCAPRVTNIHTIAGIVDGHIVKPGETFSLNGLVGKRDRARGFVPAPMILNGRFVDDVGGGISQFATTLFNAVFFGGLQDVQHTPHQFYISRYPAGRESTVSYPEPDFRFRNDSPHGVLIKTAYTDTSITVSFWSTKRYDIESQSSKPYKIRDFETATDSGPKCIPMPGARGFSIDVWRIFKKDGQVVRRQKFHTVYQPEPKLTCEDTKGG